jgi:hypothetical protein
MQTEGESRVHLSPDRELLTLKRADHNVANHLHRRFANDRPKLLGEARLLGGERSADAMADNSLDELVAEITYHYKLGQMLNDAAGEKEVRAARWRHLLVATQLLRELRSRVEATGGDYTAQIDRLIRAAKEFDRSAIFNLVEGKAEVASEALAHHVEAAEPDPSGKQRT